MYLGTLLTFFYNNINIIKIIYDKNTTQELFDTTIIVELIIGDLDRIVTRYS